MTSLHGIHGILYIRGTDYFTNSPCNLLNLQSSLLEDDHVESTPPTKTFTSQHCSYMNTVPRLSSTPIIVLLTRDLGSTWFGTRPAARAMTLADLNFKLNIVCLIWYTIGSSTPYMAGGLLIWCPKRL